MPGQTEAKITWTTGAMIALMAVLCVWYLAVPSATTGYLLISNLALIATPTLAAALSIWTSAQPSADRSFWRLICLACSTWATGQVVWTIAEHTQPVPPAFPSLADVGYIMFYPICAFALLRLLHHRRRQLEREEVLDGLIISVVAVFACYALLLMPLNQQNNDGSITIAASLVWQSGIVGLLVLAAIALTWNAASADRWVLAAFALGLVSFAVADVIYGDQAMSGTAPADLRLDLWWHAGFLLIGLAAVIAANIANGVIPTPGTIGPVWRSAGTLVSVVAFGALSAFLIAQTSGSVMMVIGSLLVTALLAGKLAYAAEREQRLATRTRERDRLAADVAARTAAAAEMAAALAAQRTANAELVRLNETKSDFIRVVSHEFRTPLTSVQGFADLLAEEEIEAADAREFATIIATNAQRLARMLDDMLELDQLRPAHSANPRECIDLNEIVAAQVRGVPDDHQRERIRLRLDPFLPLVPGCRRQLARVVRNLLDNALVYDPGRGEIVISTWPEDHSVRLSIRDHGIGIAPEDRERVFERFTRAAPLELRAQGTGLGLALVREIVTLHGGTVWAEPAVGAGTVIQVRLPAGPTGC